MRMMMYFIIADFFDLHFALASHGYKSQRVNEKMQTFYCLVSKTISK